MNEIVQAIKEMPKPMRQLWWMKLFQWYAMMSYWIYIVPALALSVFGSQQDSAIRDASLLNGRIGGFYNFVAFIAAFALIPLGRRWGAKRMHAFALSLAGVGMLALPGISNPWLLLLPMVGVGFAWASMMGNPYVMLAGCIPPERTGVYMGIFNMFIVLPMIVQMLSLPLIFEPVLGGDPRNVIQLAGALLIVAAAFTLKVNTTQGTIAQPIKHS